MVELASHVRTRPCFILNSERTYVRISTTIYIKLLNERESQRSPVCPPDDLLEPCNFPELLHGTMSRPGTNTLLYTSLSGTTTRAKSSFFSLITL